MLLYFPVLMKLFIKDLENIYCSVKFYHLVS